MIRALGRRFVGLARVLSARCAVCGRIPDQARGCAFSRLCPSCAGQLAPHAHACCPVCGFAHAHASDAGTVCGQCRLEPPGWEALAWGGVYHGLLRQLILRYKYSGVVAYEHVLSSLAGAALAASGFEPPAVAVPVPLHAGRLRLRGFNQSLALARGVARTCGAEVDFKALERVRNTPPQASLARDERKTNMKGAFRADPDRTGGKDILLVDDVYTTGSTLRECAKTLKRAGASRVRVLVLARSLADSISAPLA